MLRRQRPYVHRCVLSSGGIVTGATRAKSVSTYYHDLINTKYLTDSALLLAFRTMPTPVRRFVLRTAKPIPIDARAAGIISV